MKRERERERSKTDVVRVSQKWCKPKRVDRCKPNDEQIVLEGESGEEGYDREEGGELPSSKL